MEEEFSATIKEYQTVLESVDKKLTSVITNDRFLNDLIPKSNHEGEFVNLPINREVMNAIEIHFGRVSPVSVAYLFYHKITASNINMYFSIFVKLDLHILLVYSWDLRRQGKVILTEDPSNFQWFKYIMNGSLYVYVWGGWLSE